IFGKELGPANVKPEQMTLEVWDYVFCRSEDVDTDIPKSTLESLRRNFEYWYPLEARHCSACSSNS
ncbi:cytosolic leucyl tRNA synthetase, partial [Cryomyces antarcticus]